MGKRREIADEFTFNAGEMRLGFAMPGIPVANGRAVARCSTRCKSCRACGAAVDAQVDDGLHRYWLHCLVAHDFTDMTSKAIEALGGAVHGEAIIIRNPAKPMRRSRSIACRFSRGPVPENRASIQFTVVSRTITRIN